MATVKSSESKQRRWSQELEREIEAIEVMELLRASTPPPRPDATFDPAEAEDDGPTISRELLSEMGRRLESISVAPPPPPRRNLPAAWLALVAAVAVLSAVCAHALATMRVDDGRRIPSPSPAAIVAPSAPAVASGAIPAPPAEVAAPAAEPDRDVAAIDHVLRAADRDSGAARPVASDGVIPDNPYGSDAEAPAPAPVAAPIAPAPTADPIDALVGSALTQPERAGSSASAPTTNDLPDPGVRALPELPSRAEVSRAMDAVAGLVRQCGGDAGGRLVVEIRVTGATGRVRTAKTVDSEWSGTPAGACAARAVRIAKLPRFTADDLVVRYPFEI
jgi:hypothetical protein